MSKPPERSRPSRDPFKAAEALFKPKPPPLPDSAVLPTAKELVSLRIDRDILEHFQGGGAGWQERINEALRKAIKE